MASRLTQNTRPVTQCSETYPRVAAIVPAYNESSRIGEVLQVLLNTPEVHQVIAVSDGSTDDTYTVASAIPGVTAIELKQNIGKGGAMRTGAERADADVLVFFDADLRGLTPRHVADLIYPVCCGKADMAAGIFQGGRMATDLAQWFTPAITGQRAIKRAIFLEIPDLVNVGYGIELAINHFVKTLGFVSQRVILRGVTHPMKEEKLGFALGVISRAHMYFQMARYALNRVFKGQRTDKKVLDHSCSLGGDRKPPLLP